MNAPDAHTTIARVQRQGSGLMGALQAGVDADLTPAALGSLLGLKAHTVRLLLTEWSIERTPSS